MRLTELELGAIGRLQTALARGSIPTVANGISTFGEHAAGWFALAATGAAVDSRRRPDWIGVGVAAFAGHAGAVLIKRVVRRTRPDASSVRVLDATPSRLSFPSAHAASTTAAAVAMTPILGPAILGVPVLMGLSRVLLGVHYPTDVLAGSALGAFAGGVALRLIDRNRR